MAEGTLQKTLRARGGSTDRPAGQHGACSAGTWINRLALLSWPCCRRAQRVSAMRRLRCLRGSRNRLRDAWMCGRALGVCCGDGQALGGCMGGVLCRPCGLQGA
eukprot:361075-Chlamydomonas_euryale.AAC.3